VRRWESRGRSKTQLTTTPHWGVSIELMKNGEREKNKKKGGRKEI
jgi:hypothetical protein